MEERRQKKSTSRKYGHPYLHASSHFQIKSYLFEVWYDMNRGWVQLPLALDAYVKFKVKGVGVHSFSLFSHVSLTLFPNGQGIESVSAGAEHFI